MRGRDSFLFGAVGGLFFSMARFPAGCGCALVGLAVLAVVAAVVIWNYPLLLFLAGLLICGLYLVKLLKDADRRDKERRGE